MPEYTEINEIPKDSLRKGYYYHYKHDPKGPFNNYAYQVLGTSRHTENRSLSMVYRPLYENTYLDVDFSNRPLGMAMDMVVIGGEKVSRFGRITDLEVIEKLRDVCKEMYPDIDD